MQNKQIIYLNEHTLEILKNKIPNGGNAFSKLGAAIKMMDSIEIQINNNLEDGIVMFGKENNENE